LHALEADELVTTELEYIGKRVRKHYKLTPSGKSKTKEKVNELIEFMNTMRIVLDIKLQTA
jgi:DNA-binding PadR family transcriptional regulator